MAHRSACHLTRHLANACDHTIRATTPSISRTSPSKLVVYACGIARMNTSLIGITGSMRVRTISLRRRLSLLRSTIDRLYLGTITPTRAQEAVAQEDVQDEGEAATRTSSSPVFTRFPVRLTNSISVARANRCVRENLRFDVMSVLDVGLSMLSVSFYRLAGDHLPHLTRAYFTRQRTSTAAVPSTACAPSSGAAPKLPVPSA